MVDDFRSDPHDSASAEKLLSAVRSLRRWTWIFAAMLFGYMFLHLASTVVGIISFVMLFSEAMPFIGGVAIGLTIFGALMLALVGLPATFVALGAKNANKMIGTGDLKHLVQSFVWLRRFLVVSVVCVVLYVVLALLFALTA